MANPLFDMFNNPQSSQKNNPNKNTIQRFQEFLSNFRGDPKQKVQELIDSGQMSSEQFAQYSSIADMLMGKHK